MTTKAKAPKVDKAPTGDDTAGVSVDVVVKDDRYYQDLMFAAISSTDKGLKRLCEELKKLEPDFPSHMSFIRWNVTDEDFCSRYARAKAEQSEVLADQMLEIADDDSLDMAFKEDGTPYVNQEHIQRSKLRIETRKWIASKLKPKKYGDKIDTTISNADGTPLSLVVNFVSPGDK